MKQEVFTHTGQTDATGTPQSLSAAGNNAGQSDAVSSQAASDRVVAWLAARSPAQVDKELQWQASSLGAGLAVTYDSRQVKDQRGNSETVFFVKAASLRGSDQAAEAWLAKVRAASTSAPQALVEEWLAMLSVASVKRPDDQFSEALRMSVYAEALAGFPADVVKEALRPQRWKFWPALAEVEEVCRGLALTRQVFAAAKVAQPEAPQEPELDPDAERAAAAADARKLEAERLLSRLGFTKARTDFVRNHPMAQNLDEAEVRQSRTPHWSETAAPDDPRWDALRRSRAMSTVVPIDPPPRE